MLNDTLNQSSKFRRKNWNEINDDSSEKYNTNSQIKFKTSMLKSSLCDHSDVYILVSGTIIVVVAEAKDAPKVADRNNNNKQYLNIVHRLVTV